MTDARILDGKSLAATLRSGIAAAVAGLGRSHGVVPGIAMVLVGDDPASHIYVRNKTRQAGECGFFARDILLPANTPESQVLDTVAALNRDPAIHGFLVQMPLPRHIRPEAVIDAVDPAKDADGFHFVNAGYLAMGRDAVIPATPLGCLALIRLAHTDLTGLSAVVIGRSNSVGKPTVQLLLRENCTVTVAHSKSRDLPTIARTADILVAAVGRPELVRGDWVKPGATVIDVGINRLDLGGGKTKMVGDVAFAEAVKVAGAITPVPGGVGPMTIACLLQNTLALCCRKLGVSIPVPA